MANAQHVATLGEGVQAWNAWRAQNPGVAPDLSDLKLPASSRHFGADEGGPINLTRANLRRAVLAGADLANARLDDADLSGADLSGANLGKANLTGSRLAGANLSGAWLGDACGLTQAQVDRAYGHNTTVLPDHLAAPPAWLGEAPAAPPPGAAEPGTENADRSETDQAADKEVGNGAGRDGKVPAAEAVESDPYSILGVGREASQSEIRAAYLRLAKELHPDGRAPGAEVDDDAERLKLINDAYQKLKEAGRQVILRKAERRQRASAAFMAGVMTAVVPLLVLAGLYAVWWLEAQGPAKTAALPDRPGDTGVVTPDSARDKTGAAPVAGQTGATSVHAKKIDDGRSGALAAAREQGTREAWERFIGAFPDGDTATEAKAALASIERAEAQRRQEATDWAKVEKDGDKKALRRFVRAYPDSAHVGRAREMIAAIERAEARRRQEATDWAKIDRGGDKKELQRFVRAYPDSAHSGRAREMIAAFELAEARRRQEEIDWATIERDGNKQELERFVLAYPDGAHSGRAREMIAAIELAEARQRQEEIDWAKAEKSGEKADLQRFVAVYPDSRYVGLALDRIAEIELADIRRREAVAWAEAQRSGEKTGLERFARTLPHSLYAAEARRRLALLEAEEGRKDDAAWERAVRRHSRAGYASYLAAHPKGHHVAKARLRIAELESAEGRPAMEQARVTPGAVAEAPAARPRTPEPSQSWPSADEPFIGADGRIRR
jgi:uncharacterized protein YjbI with pentapeptide repeats/outer membrane protein assembly factor BamD (BamD/ComL family)